jgi:xanthine dehydrogenase YagS FAD-binding subunit
MREFTHERARSAGEALAALREPDTELIAGGTELVNWFKEGISAPARVVDITGVARLDGVVHGPGGPRIGALARMSDVAADPGGAVVVPGTG